MAKSASFAYFGMDTTTQPFYDLFFFLLSSSSFLLCSIIFFRNLKTKKKTKLKMKQAVLLGLCAMEAVALIDLDDTQLDRSRWSCGNCNYVDSGSRRRCNTGNGADSYPFSYLSSNLSNAAGDINPTTADTITEAENTTDGYTGATAATVAEMRTLINARTANLWSTMFCTSYLDQYNVCDENGEDLCHGSPVEFVLSKQK